MPLLLDSGIGGRFPVDPAKKGTRQATYVWILVQSTHDVMLAAPTVRSLWKEGMLYKFALATVGTRYCLHVASVFSRILASGSGGGGGPSLARFYKFTVLPLQFASCCIHVGCIDGEGLEQRREER